MDQIVAELKDLGCTDIANALDRRYALAIVLPEQKEVAKAIKSYFKKNHPELHPIRVKSSSTAKKNPDPMKLYVEVRVKDWETDRLPDELIRAANQVVYQKDDAQSRGNITPTYIAIHVGEWLKVFKKLGIKSTVKAKAKSKAGSPVFRKLPDFSYAVKIEGIDNDFFTRPFGHQRDAILHIREWQKTADVNYVDAKGKATLQAVRNWVKMFKPSEFYAKWTSDSRVRMSKSDSVKIFYKD